ncbi:hypothetical protein [Burkholderia sp. Ac-20353]|uniref:hypothetical protein n=1 Tax=Burkholderia sp. Ac-20353 TaxID=2703894 RepID=UPI00197BE899|nr:hypothetical protein [Burkholderia sp. Ac-20353]MBN3785644.1 hypothetical protein [Burkholderia sp. Ac-20353]
MNEIDVDTVRLMLSVAPIVFDTPRHSHNCCVSRNYFGTLRVDRADYQNVDAWFTDIQEMTGLCQFART